MENPKGFPHRKKAMENPRVFHSASATTNRHAAQAPPPPPPTVAPNGAAAFLFFNTTTKHRKTTTKTPIKTRKNPHSGKKSSIFGTINRPNVKQAHEKRRAQEDLTRAAEARERRSPPDKISPLYQPRRKAPGSRIQDRQPWNPCGIKEKRGARAT